MTRIFILGWALGLAVGCGDDAGTDAGTADAQVDSGSDAVTDTTVEDRAMADTNMDAGGTDAQVDSGTPPMARRMYVSVGRDSTLAVVELGTEGEMTAMPELSLVLPGRTGAMTYARTSRRIHIASGSNIATVALDAEGTPSLVGQTGVVATPTYIAHANDESTLISAYFGERTVLSHRVEGDPPYGEVTTLRTPVQPHASLVGPSGNLVYVPHRDGNVTEWHTIMADGTLEKAGELDAEPGVGPRHIIFSPDGQFAYIINEQGNSVSAHAVADNGDLARIQTITTLPEDFSGANSTADVHVTPDGRFLYGSNRGHDSIAMFSVGGDGMLTAMGQVETEARPREFDVSPDGRFVVVAGQDSGNLRSYRVEEDGTLSSIATLAVGERPAWVIIE